MVRLMMALPVILLVSFLVRAAGIVAEFHYRYPARPHECWRYLACCFRGSIGRLVITAAAPVGVIQVLP